MAYLAAAPAHRHPTHPAGTAGAGAGAGGPAEAPGAADEEDQRQRQRDEVSPLHPLSEQLARGTQEDVREEPAHAQRGPVIQQTNLVVPAEQAHASPPLTSHLRQ